MFGLQVFQTFAPTDALHIVLAEITSFIIHRIVFAVVLTIGSSWNHKWNFILLTEVFNLCQNLFERIFTILSIIVKSRLYTFD